MKMVNFRIQAVDTGFYKVFVTYEGDTSHAGDFTSATEAKAFIKECQRRAARKY